MRWEEVFDKYFIISGDPERVLVFIPGSYKENTSIRFAWTTKEDVENGLDISSLNRVNYGLYGKEKEEPSDTFNNWEYIVPISKEERICKKIRMMEERWKRFKKSKTSQ